MKKLETQVFQDDLDKKTLDTLLEMLDHIKVKYVSRKHYNDKKGDILEKTGEQDKLGEFYNLYLPNDLRVGEQVSIIYLLMNNFKLNPALLEAFIARTKVIIGIILRANSDLGIKELEDLQQRYNLPKDFIEGISNYTLKPDLETREFIRAIKGKSKNKLGIENKEKAEEVYGEKLIQELDLTFFRKSLNDIRNGLEILSKEYHKKIMNYIKSENRGKHPFKKQIYDGNIKFERTISGIEEIINIRNQYFEKESKKLRDKIGVDKLKSELEELRNNGNKEKIEEKEIEIANIILKELENGFHYILNGENNGYKPIEIQRTKEIYCIGFSIIGHSILSDFGIKHKGISMLEHSALEIYIGKNRYYFDASGNFKKIYKIIKEEVQHGSIYKKYILEGNSYIYEAIPGDTEKILLAQIYDNKGNSLYELGNFEESIKMYDKVIKLDPKNPDNYNSKGILLNELGSFEESIKMYNKAIELDIKNPNYYYNKGNSLYKLEKYEESIKMLDKAIELNSKDPDYYNNKGNSLYKLEKYEESIKMYDKAIELNHKDPDYYNNKGNSLYELGNFEESIKMYDKSIELNPKNPYYYNNKGRSLIRLGKFKFFRLYFFTYKFICEKITFEEKYYSEEKTKIKEIITKKDFEGLRLYLLSLEK